VALLPQLGTPQQFEKARRVLRNLGYDEQSVCARTHITSIFHFKTLTEGRTAAVDLRDGLDILIRLLLDCEQVAESQVEYLLPAETIAALESLRLMVQIGTHGDYFGTLRLAPIEGLYVASDRSPPLDPEMLLNGTNPVPDAISPITGEFLKSLPRRQCDSLLDLYCGSAVKGLLYAAVAKRVWACDCDERSIHFAKFNRQLNAILNVACVQGELYEGLRGETFERIVAQPPENALPGIIEGLPRHLRPGGRFDALVEMDEQAESLKDGISQWLGSIGCEFTIALSTPGDQASTTVCIERQ